MSSIKGRLLSSLGLLIAAAMVVGAIGFYSSHLAQVGLETVFRHRVEPLREIKSVADLYAVNIVDTAHKVRNGNMQAEAGSLLVSSAVNSIARRWRDYVARDITEPERAIVNEIKPLMADANRAIEQFIDALDNPDRTALDDFVVNKLYPAVEPLSEGISKLAAFQIEAAEETYSATNSAIHSANIAAVVIMLLAALAGAFSFWTTVFRVVRPIEAMTDCMRRLAHGERGLSIPGAGSKDEIGSMAEAVQIFRDNAEETLRLREEQKHIEERAAEQRKADMQRLASQFQAAVGGIVENVSNASMQLELAANALTETANSAQERSGVVASASEQTSANVQGVAAASEQLAATVSEISRQVETSSQIANQAVMQADTTNARVTDLSRSAERIGDVVELINTIAGQTNLLALNATIEAARAGEAGKGFAVVAQEVKALASQTAKATNEIATQIASMQQATREAVGAIEEITGTINQMSQISVAIATAVEQQGCTTQEISRNVMEAAKGTAEVASSISEVSRGASETGMASSEVLTSAKSLSGESTSLRNEVERFLESVRAA